MIAIMNCFYVPTFSQDIYERHWKDDMCRVVNFMTTRYLTGYFIDKLYGFGFHCVLWIKI